MGEVVGMEVGVWRGRSLGSDALLAETLVVSIMIAQPLFDKLEDLGADLQDLLSLVLFVLNHDIGRVVS
mgnify:CR=1 FL=1